MIQADQIRKFRNYQTCALVQNSGVLGINSTLLEESCASKTGELFLQNGDLPPSPFPFSDFFFGPQSDASFLNPFPRDKF